MILNRGESVAEVRVSMSRPTDLDWAVRVEPGDGAVLATTFEGDNAVIIGCQDADGATTHEGIYVTSGTSIEVTARIEGCGNVQVEYNFRSN